MQETIICSAILVDSGMVHKDQPINITKGFVVCGRRHGDCYNTIKAIKTFSDDLDIIEEMPMTSGFLTNTNRFVNRKEAMAIAMDAGQLLMPQLHSHKSPDDELYILTSEDIFPYDVYESGLLNRMLK